MELTIKEARVVRLDRGGYKYDWLLKLVVICITIQLLMTCHNFQFTKKNIYHYM